jgi:hypothetical protein
VRLGARRPGAGPRIRLGRTTRQFVDGVVTPGRAARCSSTARSWFRLRVDLEGVVSDHFLQARLMAERVVLSQHGQLEEAQPGQPARGSWARRPNHPPGGRRRGHRPWGIRFAWNYGWVMEGSWSHLDNPMSLL